MKPQTYALALTLLTASAHAAPFYNISPFGEGPLQCINGECEAAIAKTTYQNRAAYKLTNGAVDAIIIPEIGRIMSFGKTGGPNLMWNARPEQLAKTGWKNYGGDKTWLAPQENWPSVNGSKSWPPDNALDGQPHKADVLTGGKLQLTTPLSPTGIRIVRTMYFDDNGEFVIEQTARKESGAPVKASIWNVTQIVPGQAIFAAVNPESSYQDGIYRFKDEKAQTVELVKPNLLRIQMQPNGEIGKVGIDTKVAALATVRDGLAWVQKAPRPDGDYPDAPDDKSVGFPTELYLYGNPKMFYQELEFLGPLRQAQIGDSWTHTVRWSLHQLPSADVDSPEVTAAVEKLLLHEN